MPAFWEHLGAPEHLLAQELALCLLVLAATLAADRLLRVAFRRALVRANQGHHEDISTRLVLTQRLARAALWLVAFGTAAAQFEHLRALGTTLLASAGVVGVVVGVAARSTLGNVIAGAQIAFTQPIRVGDIVTLRDETGEIEDLTLAYTFIRTGDNRRLAVPNEVLSNEIIKNYSLRDARTLVSARLYVGYGADLDRVRALLLEAAQACPAWSPKSPPSMEVDELTDTGIRVKLYGWADSPQRACELAPQLREAGVRALQKAGIELPAGRLRSVDTAAEPKASP